MPARRGAAEDGQCRAMVPTLVLLRLLGLLLLLGHGVSSGPEEELAHVEQYEMVMPRRVLESRGKKNLSASPSTYLDHVLYSIQAEGRDYLLHLEKNRELLGQHYTETHYLADGTEITEKPDVQDHCFYQGHVVGYTDSAASISICGGLSGFFQVNETTFLLKPLEEDKAGWHAVYRAAHLRTKRGMCREAGDTLEYDHDPKKSAQLHKGPRYVELVLVVDNEEFRKYKDLRRVQNRMKEIVNHVDKLYQPLGLRVALIGLEVWSNRDKITISRNAEVTLENFLRWREMDLLKRKQHDNAQLITGVDFHDTTVGLAKKLAMCTRDSGGVNQDHSMDPIGAASTMAHEMGHNLGMSHDEDIAGCHCPVIKDQGGCVMAAKISLTYPKLFSSCSEQDMWQFLKDPRTSCLLNVPRADELYGEPVCGNRFVERGEQCDCGRPEECFDRCCNATTCQLREEAKCAQGDCCQDCKVKAAGTMCRASKNDCDLPEHCTGLSSECPEDVFQENGIPCQSGNGYCYNGACPSHAEQCRVLWGAAARVAPDECFNQNSRQDLKLHCLTESGKKPCSPKDVKCGTLLCVSDNTSPVLGSGFFTLSFGQFKCKAALDSNDGNEMVGNLRLVPTGTKCGEEMVCYAGRCQNLLIYGKKNCSAKCNSHGVCNHKRECHCEPGWAPPYCQHKVLELTPGGSSMILAAVLSVLALSSILLGGGVVLLRGRGMRYFQKGPLPHRTSSRTTAGLTNPVFQEGSRLQPPSSQLSHHDISSPNLLSTTAAPRSTRPLVPSCPVPQVPSRHPEGLKSLLSCPQERPKPPRKPLPALKSKELCGVVAGAPSPSPPVPPTKPLTLSSQPCTSLVLPQVSCAQCPPIPSVTSVPYQ
ncbi:disintegrin and metalloproteinase domain-containing protein 8 isoform X4 [Oxyura jamaicensis]|uniref:disintegrin and metalloproteinase domain-containing protein 8 isoform X4 n=1 Tax=Oxyura jamaicensis TaxID=8884 RepID=UPI0015A536C8|nr:disintegrin and metalloproteinase domain-containing protein 8 isoform X4 [Oxyura jamaicensis]